MTFENVTFIGLCCLLPMAAVCGFAEWMNQKEREEGGIAR